MLDPWIIEEIRRREEERQRDGRLPAVLEMPVHEPEPTSRSEQPPKNDEDDTSRGVTVIDFSIGGEEEAAEGAG